MTRVSYQQPDEAPAPAPLPAFVPLDGTALATRGKDAAVTIRVRLSKRQARWLRDAVAHGSLDEGDVTRALVDVAMQLDVDWRAVHRPSELRAALREAILVRRA